MATKIPWKQILWGVLIGVPGYLLILGIKEVLAEYYVLKGESYIIAGLLWLLALAVLLVLRNKAKRKTNLKWL